MLKYSFQGTLGTVDFQGQSFSTLSAKRRPLAINENDDPKAAVVDTVVTGYTFYRRAIPNSPIRPI
jgi:hypothetical protein